MLNVNWLTVLNVELRNGRDQSGREVGRMPNHQMMISDRLSRIDLLFREKRLPNRFRRVFIKLLPVLGKDQLASDLFKKTDSKCIFDDIQLLADARSRKPKFFRRIIDVVFLCDRRKHDEIIQLNFWPTHLNHL